MSLRRTLGALLVTIAVATVGHAQVVNSEWNTSSGSWNVASNWFPNAIPDNGGGFTYNVQIGNRPVAAGAAVTFIPGSGAADTIETLTVSGGADFLTNGFQLNVNGLTTITGASSTVRLDTHSVLGTPSLQTTDLDVTAGGALSMNGGVASVFADMDVTPTGTLTGRGTLNVGDFDLVVEQAFQNSGSIQLAGSLDSVGTLTIHANGVDTIDLDGDNEIGVIDVDNALADLEADTLTLIIDGVLTDGLGAAVGGQLQIGQRDTVTFNQDFEIDAGFTVAMTGGNNVATLNGPGDITDIAGATFAITGDAVIANSMAFTGTANVVTLNANSSLTLGGTVTMADASSIGMTSSSELIITGSTTVNEAAGDFNWDGPATATTTVEDTGSLSLTVNHVDTGNDDYGGTLNLNGNGDVFVNTVANSWSLLGTLNKNNAGTSTVSGDRMLVTGSINANAGTLDLPAVTLSPGADVAVAGILSLGGGSEFAGPTTLSGAGALRMEGNSTTSANTVINVATFDWDGASVGGTHVINNGIVLTVNSPTIDSDGDVDDVVSLGGNGAQLVVSGPAQWTLTNTVNANTAAAGIATIGGTSRVIFTNTLNVDGITNISAPVTFGAGSFLANIDAGMTLSVTGVNATYAGGTMDGLGAYEPANSNTVTGDFAINNDVLNFDGGNWVVESGAELTLNVVDYEPAAATNSFEANITLNNGQAFVNTADPEFIMNGTLNMNASGGNGAEWSGDAVDIGNDGGALDANLNVTGDGNPNSQARFLAAVDFNSDADVDLPAGAFLNLVGVVNFDTVNAANNAEFTGAGTMAFNNTVNVNEAATLNMVGGTVDLDGNDASGEFINIDAPLTINAATLTNFGRVNGGGGINTLDVNSSAGTGVLSVNLDSPSAEWTLNGPGVMNLVNDNTAATLLAGSTANLNGTVNVTGDVQIDARVNVAGVVNINTAGQPLTLAGGGINSNTNTIVGGTIQGVGTIAAPDSRELRGFGTISSPIDFDGTSALRANDGTLTIGGAITDVGSIGTADADGVLNVINAWNSNVANNVFLNGGEIKGGAITVANATGVSGHGLVSARVVNNSVLHANTGTLVFETAANDNDWDGAGAGELRATSGGLLELHDDLSSTFPFTGSVLATGGGRIFADGFKLDFNAGSSVSLTGSTLQTGRGIDFGTTLTINAGLESTVEVENNYFMNFQGGSTTTLNANVRLKNNNINVAAGATFAGTGALIIDEPSHLALANGAIVNALLVNEGTFRPGGILSVGVATVKDYTQTNTGELIVDMSGSLPNQFDRLQTTGIAQLGGRLFVDLLGGFNPGLGTTFDIVSTAFGVSGQFNQVDYDGLPAGKTFHIDYLPNAVRLTVVTTPFHSADFDDDGDVDGEDFRIWRGAFDLNQLGDSDGDNDSDGFDFLAWQRQFGAAPAVAVVGSVPEPTSAAMAVLLASMMAAGRLRSRLRTYNEAASC